MMVELLMLTALLVLHSPCTKGAYFLPTMYTFPDGLQSVNGSSSTGGCQEECVMMPITGTTISGCDCPGSLSTPANGVLIDDVIPSIDTTQRGTWATELFVVNRNGQDSFMIAFWFNPDIHLRGVEVTYLDCQIWGAGMSAINVYSSFIFPTFNSLASTRIGGLSLVVDTVQSCTSLTTVSIPIQPMGASTIIFIEFSFVGGSTVHQLNWLHLAEIRFSDVEPPTVITTTEESTEPTPLITTLSTTTTEPALSTTLSPTTDDSATSYFTSTGLQTSTDGRVPTSDETTSIASTDDTTFMDGTILTGGTSFMEETTYTEETTTAVLVVGATLMGVIAFLILLIVVIFIISFCVYYSKGKIKENHAEADHGNDEYDEVIERGVELNGVSSTIEMKVNEAYGTCGQGDAGQIDSNTEPSHVYEEVN